MFNAFSREYQPRLYTVCCFSGPPSPFYIIGTLFNCARPVIPFLYPGESMPTHVGVFGTTNRSCVLHMRSALFAYLLWLQPTRPAPLCPAPMAPRLRAAALFAPQPPALWRSAVQVCAFLLMFFSGFGGQVSSFCRSLLNVFHGHIYLRGTSTCLSYEGRLGKCFKTKRTGPAGVGSTVTWPQRQAPQRFMRPVVFYGVQLASD